MPDNVCGQWAIYFSPVKGEVQQVQMRCHDYRNCELCADLRAKEEIGRLSGESGYFVTNAFDEDGAKKLAAKLSRNQVQYRRYPKEDGSYAFLHTHFDHLDDVSKTVLDLDEFVLEHVITPAGRRITGKLGSKATKPATQNKQDVETESVIVRIFHDDDDDRPSLLPVFSECVTEVINEVRNGLLKPACVQDLVYEVEGRFASVAKWQPAVVSVKRFTVAIDDLSWGGVKIKLYRDDYSDIGFYATETTAIPKPTPD